MATRVGSRAPKPQSPADTPPVPETPSAPKSSEDRETFEGRHIYSASTMGHCHASLVMRAMGVTPAEMPEVLRKGLDEGTANEPVILDLLDSWHLRANEDGTVRRHWRAVAPSALIEAGIEMGDYDPDRDVDYTLQPRVWYPIGNTAVLRAHLDGLAERALGDEDPPGYGEWVRLIEVKAFGESLWARWLNHGLDAFPDYQWQLSTQMYAGGYTLLRDKDAPLDALFVVGHKDEDGKVFEIDVLEVDEPPITMPKILAKVFKAERDVALGRVPQCDEGRWPCAFYTMNECAGRPPVEVVEVEDTELGQYAHTHWAAGIDEKREKTIRAEATTQIRKWLDAHPDTAGLKVVVADEAGNRFEVEWAEVDQPARSTKAYTQRYARVKSLDANEEDTESE